MPKLAASILSADFANLAEQVKLVEPYADMLHIDCMDAHFVPPLTIGPIVVEALRPVSHLPLHCHLMVERPENLFDDFAKAGTDIITMHLEACENPASVIAQATAKGMRPGLAVNPSTEVEDLFPHLETLDNVIVMTLPKTGYAGQPFKEESLQKVEAVRKEIDRQGLGVDVIVDGGIDEASGRRCLAAGASVLAVASSIFKAADPSDAARRLAGIARGE